MHRVSKKHRKYDGQILLIYLSWYGIGRYFIEGLRTDSLYLFGTGVRVSQLLALVLFGVSSVLLVHNWLHGSRVKAAGTAADETELPESTEAAENEAALPEDVGEAIAENEKSEFIPPLEKQPYIDDDGYEYFEYNSNENSNERKGE